MHGRFQHTSPPSTLSVATNSRGEAVCVSAVLPDGITFESSAEIDVGTETCDIMTDADVIKRATSEDPSALGGEYSDVRK